ncbi:DNA translocase FtsK, partial [Mobiluncus curtisii]
MSATKKQVKTNSPKRGSVGGNQKSPSASNQPELPHSTLDPQVKRDILGLCLIALGILVALREWFGLSGTAGNVIHLAVAGLFGVFAVILPFGLGFLAIRLFLRGRFFPDPGNDGVTEAEAAEVTRSRGARETRILVGLSVILAALSGMVHVAKGLPWPSTGFPEIMTAGGLLGWFFGHPIGVLFSPWGAFPLLVIIMLIGILITGGIPAATLVSLIRQRFAWLSPEPATSEEEPETVDLTGATEVMTPSRMPWKRPHPQSDPEETKVIEPNVAPSAQPPVPAATQTLPESPATGATELLPARKQSGRHKAESRPPEPVLPPEPPAKAEDSLPERVHTGLGHDIDYHLPSLDLLKIGPA